MAFQGLMGTRARLGGGVIAAIMTGFMVGACHEGRATGVRPPWTGEPPSAPLAVQAKASRPPTAADVSSAAFPPMTPVLSDARLASARERVDAGDGSAAAREVDRVLGSTALSHAEMCAWTFAAARLHLAAGEATEAAEGFGRAAGDGAPCPLAAYAHLRKAQALLRLGEFDAAIQAAQASGDDFSGRDEALLALADARSGKGDRRAAVALWRSLLAVRPHGLRWVDTSIQLAAALVDGVDGPAPARASEALDLLSRVMVEAPTVAEKLKVASLREHAASLAGHASAPPLTPEENARLAQAWLDASQPKHAREVAERVLKASPPAVHAHAAAACKAAVALAQATPHGKWDDAADAWGVAISRCHDDEALVTALYQGAKASASAKRRSEALERFALVEHRFPDHRLADDARLRAGLVLQEGGDDAGFLNMLASLPEVYPAGDMRAEALFRVALSKIDSRDYAGARDALERSLREAPAAPGSANAGRAEYFRARVADLAGDRDDALARYGQIVSDFPLSYYMLLAYCRLRQEDDVAARSIIASGVDREPAGALSTRPHDEFASPAFSRFVGLLEVGDLEAARREATSGGMAEENTDPDVLWAIAWLYDRAGAPDASQAFVRSHLVDYRAHWPGGRWRLAWEVAFPRPWAPIVVRESDFAHVPGPLTWAIMREESAFNPDARSAASALGLMQLMPSTARHVAKDTWLPYDDDALRRPEVSIALGARLLGALQTSFPTHPALAIAAYNGGGTPVRRWLERGLRDTDMFVEHIAFDETRAYVKRVLSSEATYAFLYGPASLDELLPPEWTSIEGASASR